MLIPYLGNSLMSCQSTCNAALPCDSGPMHCIANSVLLWAPLCIAMQLMLLAAACPGCFAVCAVPSYTATLTHCPATCCISAMLTVHGLQEVTCQLQTFCNHVMSAASTCHSNLACTFLDLTNVEDVPIMPTLSGWLLQYPVVYLATQQTATLMAQLLSEATLVLYEVHIADPSKVPFMHAAC